MSLSNIALEQRQKETKTLTTFLVYNLVGSIVLHIGLLASGIGNIFATVPKIEEEPIELTFVETPEEEQEKLQEPDEVNNSRVLTSSANNSGSRNAESTSIQTASIAQPKPEPQVIQKQSNPTPVSRTKIAPIKPLQTLTQLVKTPANNIATNIIQPQSKPQISSQTNSVPKTSNVVNATTQPSTPSGVNIGNLVARLRNPISNSTGGSASTGTSSGGDNSGSSNSVGSGNSNTGNSGSTGNNSTNNNSTVAVAPTKPNTDSNLGNRGNGDGRAYCVECNNQYPDWARRRKVEGRVEVAVNTDAQGNVTGVRLLRSSGNAKLDAEHLERARNWKLKPSESGRSGVAIGTEYTIEGSRRDRQVQERIRQRQAQANNSPANSTAETPRRKKEYSVAATRLPRERNPEPRTTRRPRTIAAVSSNPRRSSTEQPTVTRTRRRRIEPGFNSASVSPRVTTRRKRSGFNRTASVNNSSNSATPSSTSSRRRRRPPLAPPAPAAAPESSP
ncbi:MAG TPA: energy transducer TonB [Nostocaceae cyanobacterium]|nr:energy transducer TonB [Nostocaceae cyanobacterium]